MPEDELDKKSKFAIYLNDKFIGLVNSPSYDGARLLLKMGFDHDTPMTTQAQDSAHPSWRPQPLWKWAKWTTEEQYDRAVRVKSFWEWERVGVLEGVKPNQVPTYQNSTNTVPRYTRPDCEAVA